MECVGARTIFWVPRRLGWGRPRLEVRRLPSRRTTGDSLSRTPLLFFALSPLSLLPAPFSLSLSLSSSPPLSSPIPHSPTSPSPSLGLHSPAPPPPPDPTSPRRRRRFVIRITGFGGVSRLPQLPRREAPGGAPRRPPAFAEVICLELEQFFLSFSGNFSW